RAMAAAGNFHCPRLWGHPLADRRFCLRLVLDFNVLFTTLIARNKLLCAGNKVAYTRHAKALIAQTRASLP
ncbi:MAG: hypothetical protein KGS28_04135, partial [Betaproteobacteria bacterium]|nr:hypothetical protein [Betaproteobacteria bacterium]